jgi:hypothetical protein
VKVPIACTLSTNAAEDRLGEWQAAYALVDEVDAAPCVVRLRLSDDDQALLHVVDLAQREKQCCAFFDFSIELDGSRRWLRITVPEEASDVLAAFADSMTISSG